MNKLILIIFFLLFSQHGYSQNGNTRTLTVDKNHKFVRGYVVDIRKASSADLKWISDMERLKSIAQDRFLFSTGQTVYNPRYSLAVRFEQNTGSTIYEGINTSWNDLNIQTIIIDGKASIDFANVVITKQNASDYRYRVIQNYNKELVTWSVPTNFVTTKDGKATYASLGKFDYQPNQFILIEIYNTKDFRDRHALIIDWRELKPAKLSVGMESTRAKLSGGPFYNSLDSLKDRKWENFIETTDYNEKKFRLGDSLVRLAISLTNTGFFNYDVKLKKTINGKTETLNLGNYLDCHYIYKPFWNAPGVYELTFTPKLPSPGGNPVTYLKNKAVSFKFTVLPPLHQSFEISYQALGLGIIAILILIGLIVWYFRLRNRIKLLAEKQKKDFAQMQLGSVRAQLNPHFMYNALAGIQNLINKNDIDTANRYLGKFARLTRSVLDEKNNDLTSIADEKSLLEDYLQMEQLRFGFDYNILVSNEIDIANTEIPAMLLQPFVENSIKHGISELNKAGKVEIDITKNQSDLLLIIKDNGKGFDPSLNYSGLGLKLSKNRISLLNTIYKETPIELQINSTEESTVTTITLKDWL